MKKILFFNVPGYGHVNPTLPLVAELHRRGHEIIYYNEASFAVATTVSGATFRPYPPSLMTPEEIARRAGNLVDITLLLLESSLTLLPFSLVEMAQENPDLVVFDAICLWGKQAAHLQSRPSVATITTLIIDGVPELLTWRDLIFIARTAVPRLPRLLQLRRRLVKRYGKEIFPQKDIFPCLGERNILFTSRRFQPPTSFINDSFSFVGPALDVQSRVEVDFPWSQLDGRPLILISLGTINNQNLSFYRACIAAYADYPAQFVLAAGSQTDTTHLDPVPPNFIVQPFIPQLALLAKADLFITHGGSNSIHEALFHGVPLLVVPQQLEQVANGRIVQKQGAGLVLGDRPPYGQGIAAAELRAALQKLHSTPAFSRSAAALALSLHNAGGAARAADLIAGSDKDQ